jgi:hypothetical protein
MIHQTVNISTLSIFNGQRLTGCSNPSPVTPVIYSRVKHAIAHGNVNSSDFILQLNGQVKYFNEHEAHSPTRKDLGEHISVAPIETQPYTGKAVNVIHGKGGYKGQKVISFNIARIT